ncbi:MAG: serine/threonine protein kinase, partial [Sandaracinaceae bacterium]|nr:serine/threonine protein kinase [Sandaracinaceae bacterium]
MNAEPARVAAAVGKSTDAEDLLPRRFGRYQLFDRIGKGGMATIYLARMESELGAERLVVVKQIHEALSRDPAFSTQFVDEAKLCAGLRHANIAQVVDLGRGDGVLFMAMEYVEGFDLQQLLRNLAKHKIPLPPEFVFHIVRETLAGLDFAHRATRVDGTPLGIVHRDVSPSNVLLSFEGEVKLCDFGIAKAYGRAGEMGVGDDEGATESQEASAELGEARVVGKSAYMAPEHARGEALDARADVFAAGILLWEMCAGRRLYKGSELEMLELAKRAEIPRLPQRGLAGHDELQALLDRALAPARDERFPTAQAMLEALDAYLARHRIVPSQLRFASFLTDHFGEQVIAERRARELAAKEIAARAAAEATAAPAARPEPGAAPRPSPEPGKDQPKPGKDQPKPGKDQPKHMPLDFDPDVAEERTVLKPPPRAPHANAAGAPGPTAASATAASAVVASAAPPSTSVTPIAPANRAAEQPTTPSTAHLGIAAMVLAIVAAVLGA